MKIDLHVHTKYSGDSTSEPVKIMKYALKRGLDGVAVTDHNTTKGWKDMVDTGKEFDLEVVRGVEALVDYNGERFEILGLFMKEDVETRELYKFLDQVKEQGGITSIPHPFDPFKHTPNNPEFLVESIDAIEVFNARCPSVVYNKKALNFAKKHDLGMTAGSDAHTPEEVGNAYTVADVDNLEDFKKAILEGKTKINGRLIKSSSRIRYWFNKHMSAFR